MKKIILGVICIGLIFNGCVNTQTIVDKYIKARTQAIKNVKVVKCEKSCFEKCDLISNDIDRIDCKIFCVESCHSEAK